MPLKDKLGRSCGFLLIEEGKGKKFNKRFFIVNSSHKRLEWYTNNPDDESKDVTLCSAINLHYVTNVDEARKMKLDHCFVINTVFQSYYVQAKSQTEMEEWIEILNDASKIIVPPEVLQSQTSVDAENEQGSDTSEPEQLKNGIADGADPSSTRTEIVGNVVVTKKIGESRKLSLEESMRRQTRARYSVDLSRNLTMGANSRSPVLKYRHTEHVDIIKKGWIAKQNRAKKTFKPRYLVLRKDGFLYYKSEKLDKGPLHFVSITETFGAKTDEDTESWIEDNIVIVITVNKVYYFQAENKNDMQSWVESFNKTVQVSKTQVPYRDVTDRHNSAEIIDGRGSPVSLRTIEKQLKKHSSLRFPYQRNGRNRQGVTALSRIGSIGDEPLYEDEEPDNYTPPSSDHMAPINDKASGDVNSIGSAKTECSSCEALNHPTPFERRSSYDNYVTTHLDPQVDSRAAVKPSMLKKKKTLGIIFSFNNMLSKKRERILRDSVKYKQEQKNL